MLSSYSYLHYTTLVNALFSVVQEIKRVFQDCGFLPVPDSTDMTFLTTELKRRQHCQKHGIKQDLRQVDTGTNSGIHGSSGQHGSNNQSANVGPSKRHSHSSAEDHDVPRKVRVLQQGRQWFLIGSLQNTIYYLCPPSTNGIYVPRQ